MANNTLSTGTYLNETIQQGIIKLGDNDIFLSEDYLDSGRTFTTRAADAIGEPDFWQRIDVQPSNSGSPKILSLSNITDLTDLISPNQLKENDLIILTDIEENKDYQYTVNGNTKTFRGNPDFDLMFRCATNNEFKPIMFSPIL